MAAGDDTSLPSPCTYDATVVATVWVGIPMQEFYPINRKSARIAITTHWIGFAERSRFPSSTHPRSFTCVVIVSLCLSRACPLWSFCPVCFVVAFLHSLLVSRECLCFPGVVSVLHCPVSSFYEPSACPSAFLSWLLFSPA